MREGKASPEVAEARSRLRRLGIRAAKGLGQHFLIDRRVLDTIVNAADLSRSDTVVEVGPGLGVLTDALVEHAGAVIAVEVDPVLSAGLARRYSGQTNVTILNADVLTTAPSELVDSGGYRVLGNLPYYAASPILRHFLEAEPKPDTIVVMLQKEVADAVAASPGSMSIISVAVQLYGKPTLVDYVPRSSFYPLPKVDSAVVRVDVYPEPAVAVAYIEGFFDIVRAGFSTPRKQIRNSLAVGLGVEARASADILKGAGIDPTRRPQTLSLEEWARLHQAHASQVVKQ